MMTNIFILLLVVAAAWIVYRYFKTDSVVKTEYSDTTVGSVSRPVTPAEPELEPALAQEQPLDYAPVVKKKKTRKKKTTQTKTAK